MNPKSRRDVCWWTAIVVLGLLGFAAVGSADTAQPTNAPGQPSASAVEASVKPTLVTIEARFVMMPRSVANELFPKELTLGTVSVVHEEALRRLRDLEKQKKVTVLCQPKISTVSANTAQVKSVKEVRYPTTYFPQYYGMQSTPASTNAAKKPVENAEWILVPGGFETREVGTLLNVTPTVGADGKTVNLTLVPELSTMDPVGKKYDVIYSDGKVSMEQPIFRSTQLTTTVQMQSGTTILLAVADPIEAEEGTGQVTLIFLTSTAVGLQ